MSYKPLSAQKKVWIWTVVDHFKWGILGWAVGDHSATIFEPLWAIASLWQFYFYVSDRIQSLSSVNP